MKVPQEDLNAMATLASQVNSGLLGIGDRLRRANAPGGLQAETGAARQKAGLLLQKLQRAGADDPLAAQIAERLDHERRAGRNIPEQAETPLHLLSSPAARRYAEAIRAAAVACRAMETERYGPDCDGFAEMLEDAAEDAELEAFGPKTAHGLE